MNQNRHEKSPDDLLENPTISLLRLSSKLVERTCTPLPRLTNFLPVGPPVHSTAIRSTTVLLDNLDYRRIRVLAAHAFLQSPYRLFTNLRHACMCILHHCTCFGRSIDL